MAEFIFSRTSKEFYRVSAETEAEARERLDEADDLADFIDYAMTDFEQPEFKLEVGPGMED